MEFKESKDNPLHRDYGLWSNTRFVLNRARKYCPLVFLLGSTDLFCGSVQSYLGGFLSKFILDAITVSLPPEEKQRRLLWILVIGSLVALIISFSKIIAGSMVWPRYIYVRTGVIHERVAKAMRMDYELLERPEALDLHQRASNSTDGNSNGFEGMLHILQDLGRNVFTTIVTFVAVLVLDYRLILACSTAGFRKRIKRKSGTAWLPSGGRTTIWPASPSSRNTPRISACSPWFPSSKGSSMLSMKPVRNGSITTIISGTGMCSSARA